MGGNLTDDLTCKDVAQRIKVSIDWVRERCNEGTFPNAYRLADGGPWRIPREDVDRWREARKRVEAQVP